MLIERVLENDADVLELAVEIGGRGEAEAEPDELGRRSVEKQGAHDQGPLERPGANLDLAHDGPSPGRTDGERIAERVVIGQETGGSEGMDDIAHLITFADANHVAEI